MEKGARRLFKRVLWYTIRQSGARFSILDTQPLSTDIAITRRTMTEDFVPGVFVRHPARPDWGIGQIQSVIGPRITVNFEHAGKILINGAVVTLEVVGEPDR